MALDVDHIDLHAGEGLQGEALPHRRAVHGEHVDAVVLTFDDVTEMF